MGLSNTPNPAKDKLIAMASQLGAAVLKEKTPEAARAFIGWVAELGPQVHMPAHGELETALDLAVEDMLKADIRPGQQIPNYDFWQGVAKMYGLETQAKEYNAEITRLTRLVQS